MLGKMVSCLAWILRIPVELDYVLLRVACSLVLTVLLEKRLN